MIKNPNFEIISISDDHMAIPIGKEAIDFHGVISLSEASAFLLGKMTHSVSKEDLLNLLLEEYNLDEKTAKEDIDSIIDKFIALKLVII